MNAREPIKIALTSTQNILNWYLSDLSDADLTVRPVPSANNIAWQLGHLITSEAMVKAESPGAIYPDLPAFFGDNYGRKGAGETPPGGYRTKAEYLDWFNKVRTATIANLDKITDADLDKPTSANMAKFAPNLAALYMLNANHTMMHAGQFTVVRRALGKPVLF